MVKSLIFCLSIASCSSTIAQDNYFRPGTLKATMTYGVGDMLSNKDQNYYLAGYLEYVLDDHFSFRGDTYLLIPTTDEQISSGKTPLIRSGGRNFFGAFYNVGKGNFKYNVGLQTGISLLNVRTNNLTIPSYEYIISPGINIQTGATFYVWKYFNFFAQVNYVRSRIFGVSKMANNADELIFTAGLGFQIQTKNKY